MRILKEKISYLVQKIKENRLAFFLCVSVFLFWFALLSYKYKYFAYYDWDLALYSQTMWNLVHGTTYVSLFGMSFLGNHPHFIAFLLIPLYALIPHPLTLVALKILSYCSGGFVLYLIAKKSLGKIYAIWAMILYLAYAVNIFAVLYEFHFESLVIVFLFLMFYFYSEKRFTAFVLTCFLAALTKEYISFILVAFGIYALFERKEERWKWGLTPLIMGVAIFIFGFLVVVPAFRSAMHTKLPYMSLYKTIGANPGAVVETMISKPLKVISLLLRPVNRDYLFRLFGPLFIPSFLSPHILFLIFPIILIHCLSQAYQQHSIYYHYAMTIVPFIFLASVNTFRWIKEKFRPATFKTVFIVTSVLCVLYTLSYAPRYKVPDRWKDRKDSFRARMVKEVPKDASVVATLSFLDKLSARRQLYSYLDVLRGRSYLSERSPYPDVKDVAYALIDFGDSWVMGQWLNSAEKSKANTKAFFLDHPWKVVDAAENIMLLKKGTSEDEQVLEISNRPFLPGKNKNLATVDEKFSLVGFKTGQKGIQKRTLPMTLYWKSLKEINQFYKMIIVLEKDKKIFLARKRLIGYSLYPTCAWQKGDYIKEHYWLPLPGNLPNGNYHLRVIFLNASKGIWAKLQNSDERRKDGNNPVYLTDITIK